MFYKHTFLAFAAYIIFSLSAVAADLAERLQPLIASHEGEVAVAVKHLKSGEEFAHRADVPMPTASLIKLPIMVEAYRQAHEGKLNLAESVTLKDEDKVPGSGILTTHFSAGTAIPLRDAVRLMIAYSDNTATNLVLTKIGLPATNSEMERLELPHTKVHSFVFRRESSILPERSKEFGLGSTTAAEMVRLLVLLHEKKLVSPEACDEMLAHLRTCEDKRVPKLLPPGTKVAHKTGSVAAVRTAAAIIEAPSGPIALCVLTRNNKDQRWTDENAGKVLTSKIAKELYDYFEAGRVIATDERPTKLQTGATGEIVQALQRTLNARLEPSPDLSVDGDYGPATKAAVQAFQKSKDLEPTGEVGPETFQALGPLVFEDAAVPEPEVVNNEQLPRGPREALDGPPHVTCKAWIVADAKSGNVLASSNADMKLDIASTTKMMTAYIVCQLAESDPKVLEETITFSAAADKTPGTTAGIKEGEQIKAGELLYGLMLPSGNDASLALAEHFGVRFAERSAGNLDSAAAAAAFIGEMNRQAEKLGMSNTKYENPHGLTSKEHKSSARDQMKLAQAALQNSLFRKYISTRQHGAKMTGPGGYERNLLWKNTNKLLPMEGYSGVKTGTTDAAGACLVALGERDGRELIVVVLGSASSDARYVDSRNLFRWAWKDGLRGAGFQPVANGVNDSGK